MGEIQIIEWNGEYKKYKYTQNTMLLPVRIVQLARKRKKIVMSFVKQVRYKRRKTHQYYLVKGCCICRLDLQQSEGVSAIEYFFCFCFYLCFFFLTQSNQVLYSLNRNKWLWCMYIERKENNEKKCQSGMGISEVKEH